MEQLGRRSGPAARLDAILRHLSPRLGAASAPVSFLTWGGKQGGAGRWPRWGQGSAFPAPASFAHRSPHPACLCVHGHRGGVRWWFAPQGHPAREGRVGHVPALCPGYGVATCSGAVPRAAPRRAGVHQGSASPGAGVLGPALILPQKPLAAQCFLPELQPCNLSGVGMCVWWASGLSAAPPAHLPRR